VRNGDEDDEDSSSSSDDSDEEDENRGGAAQVPQNGAGNAGQAEDITKAWVQSNFKK